MGLLSKAKERQKEWDIQRVRKLTAQGNKYIVQQIVLHEALLGVGSNLTSLMQLQNILNLFADEGYKLHTVSVANGGSKGAFGGDKLQATVILEKE